MQVRNLDIWQAREPLEELLRQPWPLKTAYALAKQARKIKSHATLVEEVRVKLIQQYGTRGDKGQISITEQSENWTQFAEAFEELMSKEEELDIWKVMLPDVNGLTITPATLLALEAFVEMAT